MYRVLMRHGWEGQEYLVHSDIGNGPRLMAAKIAKSVTSFDTLTLTADPSNVLFSAEPLQTFIRVVRTDKQKQLFEGRIWTLQPGMATDGTITNEFTVMGLEDLLHDSVQPWKEYRNVSPKNFLQSLITEHNKQVESYKQVKLGIVTVTNTTDNVYRFTDDSKDTYDTIQDKLVSRLGGEIRIRHEADGLYLDYMPQISEQSNQVIRLASNMMNLTQKLDPTAVVTVLKPLGKAADRTNTSSTATTTETSTPRLTIESVNGGSPYLRDEKLISQFGVITVSQNWDDVTDAKNLMAKGQAVLDAQNPVKQQVQIAAADLSFGNSAVDDFQCGNYNRIVNQLLGYDQTLRIVSQDIDLCAPGSSTLQAGDVMLTQEDYVRQLTATAKNAQEIATAHSTQIASLSSEVTSWTDQQDNFAESEKALKALRAQPTVKLTTVAGVLQINYTIVPGAIRADTYTPELSADQNDWTPGDTIATTTGTFYLSEVGDFYVRVKATLDGYDSSYSPAARVAVTNE